MAIDLEKDARLPSHIVRALHHNADTDGSPKSVHHTLGPGPNQAAPGNHTHDGGQSATLDGEVDTGWLDIAVSATFAAMAGTEKPQARKIGNKVWLRGGFTNAGITATANFNVGTLPTGTYPPVNMVVGIGGSSAAASASANINTTTGVIQLRTSATVGSYYKLDGISYLSD